MERAAQIIGVDVASYWTPDAEFFGRITKGQMEEIATEVIDPEFAQRHQKDKKGVYAEAMGNVFNPEVKTIGIKAPTRKRLAAWVPECMTVQPVATPAKKDKFLPPDRRRAFSRFPVALCARPSSLKGLNAPLNSAVEKSRKAVVNGKKRRLCRYLLWFFKPLI